MASRLVLLLQRCRPPLLQQGTLQCSQLTLSGSTRDLGMKEGNVHAAPTCDTNMQWVNQKMPVPFMTLLMTTILCGFFPRATRPVQMTLANTVNLALTPAQLLMMPWFMEMGAQLLSWEQQGIMSSFLKGLQDKPLSAIMDFKSYLFAGLLAWLLHMLIFAPLLYYSARFVAQKLMAAKERKMSV